MAAVAPATMAAMTTSLAASAQNIFASNRSTTMTTTMTGNGQALECTEFVRYPGYTGPVNATGTIVMVDHAPSYTQDVYWLLNGVDPTCMVAAASERQCGIRLIEGTDCAAPEGNDLFSHKLEFEDPWGAIHYDTDLGSSRSSNERGQSVSTGMSLSDLAGHAMIIYDSVFPGEAAACCVMHITSLMNVSWTRMNSMNSSNVTVIANVKPVAITRRPWWVVVVWCLAIVAIVALMCFALPCCGADNNGEEDDDVVGANPVEKGKGLAKKVKDKLRRRAEEAEDQDTESRQPLTEGPAAIEEETRRSSSRKKSSSTTSCFAKVTPCSA